MVDLLPVEGTAAKAGGLGDERRAWTRAAWERIDTEELRELVADLVGIPSPTGEERTIAAFCAEWLGARGLQARRQAIDERQGNAIGRAPGTGNGPALLLYAPTDTVTTGDPAEDVPGVGPTLRSDMRTEPTFRGDLVIGLGASNPKGHAACVMAAAAAVARAGVPLRGDLVVGLGAGGMPTNRRPQPGARANAGQGNGCSFLLEQGLHTDYAIIAKPGWSVAWEEVGLCWFRVTVRGTYNYVGSRHRLPYRNAIVDAATVVAGLEAWFPEWTRRHTGGLVAPQGQVGWIGGGWERMPAFSPASCDLLVDLRISPRTPPVQAKREFGEALDALRRAHPELDLDWEMVLAIPGTATPPDSWIVRSCTRAWEEVEGRPHEIPDVYRTTSGATDANILRGRGIPTARVGMPRVRDEQGEEVDFAMGLNAVDVGNMHALTRLLVLAAIDTCTRTYDALDAGWEQR
jgi:acetylornithine deacetylase/succinyl-diaminopimelate desuccinylase-like protein